MSNTGSGAGVTTEELRYRAAGLDLEGTLALPAGEGPMPAVLIAHEGGGLDRYQRERAARFAEQGFVAFALDYHGPHAPFPTQDAMVERRNALLADPFAVRSLVHAGHDILRGHDRVDAGRIAAVGYCLGGAIVLEYARTGADLRGIVGLHPALTPISPADSLRIVGEVLIHVGSDDPLVTAEDRHAFEAEMSAAGVRWEMHVHGGVRHSYTNESIADRPSAALAYDERAARHTWSSVLAFLDCVLDRSASCHDDRSVD
ncbi:dienelactone hydrolase family protein [Candidatus Poriferisodalis sp.]|uniref:dienelactone hydrolase family protein n=1 Tax=Candidatus Poriferisodalis sp. TaxID=3101277 RepID=UPI003B5165B2